MLNKSKILILFFAVLSNCSSPPPDPTNPKGAYALYISSLEKKDYGIIYDMMYSKVKEEIDETYTNLRKAESLIQNSYPAALREDAFKELGDKKFREAQDEKNFFIALVSSTSRPTLSLREKIGIRVKSIKDINGTIELRTMAGDTYRFTMESNGVYYFIPSEEDLKSINSALIKSREVLAQIIENVKKLEKIK